MNRAWFEFILVLLLSAAGWWLAKACAPSGAVAIFSYSSHPDQPDTGFIDGRMGVLQPTFARSYLVIAYRYLNDVGLDAREREQARAYYESRKTGEWDTGSHDWFQRWRDVRATVKAIPAPDTQSVTSGKLAYDPQNHDFGLNCAEDAFRVAANTLEARRDRFGIVDPAFLEWVKAQDAVFQNCDSSHAIPPEPSSELPREFRDDRHYQIAAALFYAGNMHAAIDRFRLIGRNPSSEWSTISRYLIVRALLRIGETDKVKAEANTILSDASLSPIHGMTWNLVERADIAAKDPRYFNELGHLLASPVQDETLREELWNYTMLYDKLLPYPGSSEIESAGNADLTDWIVNFQSQVRLHALERWNSKHSSAWLLAALKFATPEEADHAGLLTAAAALPKDSPAYLTAAYFVNRIALESGKTTEARAQLGALLGSAEVTGLPSSVNLFRGLRMRAALTMTDFLQFALRRPVLITDDLNLRKQAAEEIEAPYPMGDRLLDEDAAKVLNRAVSFTVFQKAALSRHLPAPLRQQILMAAFTRGFILHQDISDLARKLGDATPGVKRFTEAYTRETTDEGRQFATAFLLLHRPEARPFVEAGIGRQTEPGKINPYRDNWWCAMDFASLRYRELANDEPVMQKTEYPDAGNRARALKEWQALSNIPGAQAYLGSIVLTRVRLHPEDPRIPEALHELVVPGHLACDSVGTFSTGIISQRAFEVLHRRYPNSIWAKRTPIWWR